ncbi:coth protein-domain-containing protein [Linnemannia elongata]|nr:coth protein-domain-containing protein [Linnemannia elongata]
MVRVFASMAGLLTLTSAALAQITFNVVGYPSAATGSFGVSINGQITKLTATEDTFPVFSGVVPTATSSVQYSYVELDATGAAVKTEAFVRQLHNVTATHSYNEFFERPTTKWTLPPVPYTYLATWPSYTKIFDDDEIATIHVTADVAQMAALIANPQNDTKTDIRVTFRWIDHNDIYTQHNISFTNSGKSSKEYQKQAYKFSFDTDYNQTFYSRPNIKLRSEVSDPTMLREKTYIDLLNSAGIPTQQAQYVRLFINNQPFGLYMMVDDIKKSFVKQTIHGGDPSVIPGSMVQMNAPLVTLQADLIYKGPTNASYDASVYAPVVLGNNPVTDYLQQLIAFMKDLQDYNPATTPDPVGYWNNTRLDLDGFLRNMALEYLAGAYDNYWMSGSNYFMYFNPKLGASGKWQWIPTDFDGTFGDGYPTATQSSYQTWVDLKTYDHPLISKLILNTPAINALFETTLKELIQTVYKPEALFPRIMAYNQMLLVDYTWDVSINRTGPGKVNGYTVADFNNNLVNMTKDMSYSVKGWITDMSNSVSTALKFTIPAGVANRVEPPPKPTKDDGKNKGGNASGGKNGAAGSVVASTGLVAVLVGVASLVSLLL